MSALERLKLGVVTCGFLGLAPVAPGTFGTLGGVLLAWLLAGSRNYLLWSLLLIGVLYAVGCSLGEWSERRAGGKDPGFFVLDEVIGYLVCCLWVRGPSLLSLAVAFFLFRLFDIVKPPPVRRVERIGGGDGILLDDVLAGVYGWIVLAGLRLLVLEPERWFV